MAEVTVTIKDCSHFSLHERVWWYYSNLNCCPLSNDEYLNIEEPGCVLTEQTLVHFHYSQQRVLIALDMSQSVFCLLDEKEGVLATKVIEVVSSLLQTLLNEQSRSSELYLGLGLLYSTAYPIQMVVQSYHFTCQHDIEEIVGMLELHFRCPYHGLSSYPSCDLNSMLKVCFYSLSLMPESCVPVLILVTDGVSAGLELGGYDDLLMQLHRADISLNIVDIGLFPLSNTRMPTPFGCTRNTSLLRFITETTHGVYSTPHQLGKSYSEGVISKSLSRRLRFHSPSESEKDHRTQIFGGTYEVECSQGTYLRCRVTEGFEIVEFAGRDMKMEKRWNMEVTIRLKVEMMEPLLQKVTISVLCPPAFQEDIQEGVNPSPDRKRLPKEASKLHWFLAGMKETERFAGNIEHSLSLKNTQQLCDYFSPISIAKLHRWLTLFQIYVVTARTKSQKMISEGKMMVESTLDKFADATDNKESCYVKMVPEYEKGFVVLKVHWDGRNVAVVHVAFFSTPSAIQHTVKNTIRSAFKQHHQLVVFPRPLTKLLTEPIFSDKRYRMRQLSLFNFHPPPNVIKTYLLRFNSVRQFVSTSQAVVALELVCRSRVREEFFYIGESDGSKWQFIKNVQLQSCLHHCKSLSPKSMLQYIAYLNKSDLHTDIYMEPNEGFFEGHNEQESFKMLVEYITKIDEHIELTVKSFHSVLLQCIEHKIGTITEEINPEARTLAETDDLYCYLPSIIGTPDTYQSLKVDFYAELYRIYTKYEPEDGASMSVSSTALLDDFDPETKEACLCSTLEGSEARLNASVLVSEMQVQFRAVADHWQCSESSEVYFRYISEYELFAWKLPTAESVVRLEKVVVEYYHCKLLSLFPECTIQPSFPFFGMQAMVYLESSDSSKVMQGNTILLLDKVLDLSIAHALADALQSHNGDIKTQDVLTLLSKCRCIQQVVDISDMRELLVPEWNDLQELAHHLISQAIILESEQFQTVDREFEELIGKFFNQIPGLQTYYVTVPGEILFLTLGENANSLSSCLFQGSFELKYHFLPCSGFFDDTMAQQFKLPTTQIDELSKTSQQITANVTTGIQSSMAERTLELLRLSAPISAYKLSRVTTILQHLSSIHRLHYTLQFTLPEKVPTEAIEWELAHGHVINVRQFEHTFFVVSSQHFINFYATRDLENYECPVDFEEQSVHSEPYEVPFWLLLHTHDNSIDVSYHLPSHLTHTFLTPEIVEKEMTNLMRLLEKRVAQRLLLRHLVETGNCSPLLFHEETQPKTDDSMKSPGADRGRDWVKSRRSDRKPTNATKGTPYKPEIYKPDLKYMHIFHVSDRLSPDEATNQLLRKFSIPPFEINNRKRLFMFQKGDFVFLFRFMEETSAHVKQRSSSNYKADSARTTAVRVVKLEVFGIDTLQQSFIDMLRKNTDEQLFQLSLGKLADSLVKNQKLLMTFNDVEFIKGHSPCLNFCYLLPDLISDRLVLLRYVKQCLSRFLTPVKIKDCSHPEFEEETGKLRHSAASACLLYNFLNILDSSIQRSQTKLPGKLLSSSGSGCVYLGTIFGKALALIYMEITFFDGSCSNPVDLFDLPPDSSSRTITENEDLSLTSVLEDLHALNPKLLPQNTEPGYYLEVKLYRKGPLNESLFTEHVHGCIHQSIMEYSLELLFDHYNRLPQVPASALEDFHSCATRLILRAQNVEECPSVPHSCVQVQLLSLAIRLCEIVCTGNLPIVYTLKFGEDSFNISNSIEEVKKLWTSVCPGNTILGKQVSFRILMGPEAIAHITHSDSPVELNDDSKFYSDEDILGLRVIPRTPYLSVVLTNTHVQGLMYNLNRSLAHNVLTQIEQTVAALRKGSEQMRFALMQKLGVSFVDTANTVSSDGIHVQQDFFQQNLPRAFLLLEDKGIGLLKFPSVDTASIDSSSEDNLLKYRIQGMHPLIKHEKDLLNTTDPVKKHTSHFQRLAQAKRKLLQSRHFLIWVLKKWGVAADRYLLSGERISEPISLYRNSELRETMKLMKEYGFLSAIDKSKVQLLTHLKASRNRKGEEKKLKSLINKLVDAYAEKFRRNMNGFEYITKLKEAAPRLRKISTTDAGSRDSSGQDLREKVSMTALDAEMKITHQSVLRKIMDETLIVTEFMFENFELTVTCYCLEHFSRIVQDGHRGDLVPSEALKRELNRIRGQVKTFSFLYEYQIRLAFQYLSNPREFPAIDIVDSFDSIMKRYKKAPPGSSAWLYRGIATIDLGAITGGSEMELFLYLVHNCDQYNLKSFESNLIQDMVVYEIMDLETHGKGKDNAEKSKSSVQRAFLYQRVGEPSSNKRLRPPLLLDHVETSNKIRIRYYILGSDPARKSRPYESFKELKHSTERMIAAHMKKVREDFHRDQLYERLHDHSGNSQFSFGDLQNLLSQSEVRRLEDIDPRISELTAVRAFDRKFVDYIKEKYSNFNRLLENGDLMHLLVFKSKSQFAYLTVQPDSMQVEMKLVQKNKNCLPGEQEDLISNLIKEILLWFWSSLSFER